jgi:WXXGXW repeat (2 copies)
MRLGILIAGLAMLTIASPALADAPIALQGVAPTTQIAQAQTLPFPPPVTVLTAPPAPQPEFPPPAPSPTYVWQPGHWSWSGVQYFWEPGKYVERPTASASYVPGHWEQRMTGWVWVDGRWEYPSVGSSTPPVR